MVAINPDPHAEGYKFSPIHCVVGIFRPADTFTEVANRLQEAGFADEEIAVFVGEEGIRKLDSSGERHGIVTSVLRDLQQFLTDETDLLVKVDEAIAQGGCAIKVYTRGEEAKKECAAQILKEFNSDEISYWGHLVTEKL
jgi:hypothetical protein